MLESVYGKTIADWITEFPLMKPLMEGTAVTWFNPAVVPVAQALDDIPLTAADVADASARLARFAPYLATVFPEVEQAGGIIESELIRVERFARQVEQRYAVQQPVSLLLKKDSHLPIAGSVKARGGIYEVLYHAEQLALRHGLLNLTDDYRILAQPAARDLFRRHKIAVGSTGNLGMSFMPSKAPASGPPTSGASGWAKKK